MYTRGPWTAEFNEKWPFDIEITAGDAVVLRAKRVCHSTGQKTIQDCRDAKGFKETASGEWAAEYARRAIAEQEANITLIAAAPDLLKSLEWALAMVVVAHLTPNGMIAYRDAQDAIAKAEDK